jgi:hypothetical protein
MALDATVGGVASNSYASRADAQSYFGDRLNVAEWDDAADLDKDRALVMATRRLEAEEYVGVRVDINQALQWPRYSTYDRDGLLYDTDAIPEPVKAATYEFALALLKDQTLLADTGLEGFQSVTLGALSVTPRARRAAPLPAVVERLLAHLLTSSGYSVHVVRA